MNHGSLRSHQYGVPRKPSSKKLRRQYGAKVAPNYMPLTFQLDSKLHQIRVRVQGSATFSQETSRSHALAMAFAMLQALL